MARPMHGALCHRSAGHVHGPAPAATHRPGGMRMHGAPYAPAGPPPLPPTRTCRSLNERSRWPSTVTRHDRIEAVLHGRPTGH